MDITGLVPAGGKATRLGVLPCSKEILPVNYSSKDKEPFVVSENLLGYYKTAGIKNVYFIIRQGKWDIPAYYLDGARHQLNIGYLIMNLPYGVPYTLDQAYPFIRDTYVALGFPDIIIKPEDAFLQLKEKLQNSDADIMLGVFPIKTYNKWDMVEFDHRGKIKNIVIKQERPDLKYGWSITIWSPKFTEYMHEYLKKITPELREGKIEINGHFREIYPGDIIQNAINDRLKVDYVLLENGSSVDIGTPDDLSKTVKSL